MQAGLTFWVLATALVLAVGLAVLGPLWRGRRDAERRASYDLRVYRDQLREVESDLARGAISADEAAAVRVEVSRRLLAAADAEAAERAAGSAPPRASRRAAAAAGIGFVAAALVVYAGIGASGRPDQPLAARLAALAEARAERPGQAEVEAMAGAALPEGPGAAPPALAPQDAALIEQLRAAVAARPGDAEGNRLLARAELSLGNWAAARAARARVVEILGDEAAAEDLVGLAESMILAANGYVSPEAEALLTRALAVAPEEPVARYYSGLALLQGGRADLAYQLWSRLLAEGPPGAPWLAPIEAQIAEVAALAGRPAPPSAAAVEAAGEMSPEDRAAMIDGMVGGLSERLAAEGGPPEDWAQLIRALAVLGRRDEAAAIWREAREAFAADPAALGLLRETAAQAGISE